MCGWRAAISIINSASARAKSGGGESVPVGVGARDFGRKFSQ